MILHRLADAVRAQNWFTVALEVLIVVVGIFIGLQVDDWNRARIDRSLEQEYLARLHADAISAVMRQRDARNWNDERVRTQALVLAALRAGVLKEEDRGGFGAGLAHAGSHNPPIWQWGTVEELYATGSIRLIRDATLRDLIGETETSYLRSREIIDAAKQQIHLSRNQISDRFDPIEFGFSTGAPVEIRFDFDDLARDAAFIAAFSNLHLNSTRIIVFLEDHLESLETLEAGIARARGLDPMASANRPGSR